MIKFIYLALIKISEKKANILYHNYILDYKTPQVVLLSRNQRYLLMTGMIFGRVRLRQPTQDPGRRSAGRT